MVHDAEQHNNVGLSDQRDRVKARTHRVEQVPTSFTRYVGADIYIYAYPVPGLRDLHGLDHVFPGGILYGMVLARMAFAEWAICRMGVLHNTQL